MKKVHKKCIIISKNNHKEHKKHPEQPNPKISGELMKLVLKNNVFDFNEQFYLQI